MTTEIQSGRQDAPAIDPYGKTTRAVMDYRWHVIMTDVEPFQRTDGSADWSETNSKLWKRLDEALERVVQRMAGDRSPSDDYFVDRIREQAWDAIRELVCEQVTRLQNGELRPDDESEA